MPCAVLRWNRRKRDMRHLRGTEARRRKRVRSSRKICAAQDGPRSTAVYLFRTAVYTSRMIRPATASDTPALLALSADTGFFKPLEVETLDGVLKDYYATYRDQGHRCVVWAEAERVLGYLYYAPEEMTDRTWCVWWIAVAADQQG